MAGPAPKYPEARARQNPPARGEWITLRTDPFMGSKPKRPTGLLAKSRSMWDSWWETPMAHEWTEAEKALLVWLIDVADQIARKFKEGKPIGVAPLFREMTQLHDRLGLTEKGRRDLRWRLPRETEQPTLAEVVELPSRKRSDPRKK